MFRKLKLDDHLYIDNFKKNLAVNFGIFDNPKTGQARSLSPKKMKP